MKLSRKKQSQYNCAMLWEIWKVCIKKSKQSRKAKNILGCDAILLQVSETALSLSFSGKMRIEWSDMTHSCWDFHEENFIIQGMNLKSKGEKKFILNTCIMFGFDKYWPFLTWNVRTPPSVYVKECPFSPKCLREWVRNHSVVDVKLWVRASKRFLLRKVAQGKEAVLGRSVEECRARKKWRQRVSRGATSSPVEARAVAPNKFRAPHHHPGGGALKTPKSYLPCRLHWQGGDGAG